MTTLLYGVRVNYIERSADYKYIFPFDYHCIIIVKRFVTFFKVIMKKNEIFSIIVNNINAVLVTAAIHYIHTYI